MSCTALFPRLGSSPLALALHIFSSGLRGGRSAAADLLRLALRRLVPVPPLCLYGMSGPLCAAAAAADARYLRMFAVYVSAEVRLPAPSLSGGGDVCEQGQVPLLSESPLHVTFQDYLSSAHPSLFSI